MNKLLIIMLILLTSTLNAFSENKIIFLATNIVGKVEFSKDGNKWKQINKSKYIFDGYWIRTGNDANCHLIGHPDSHIRQMENNTSMFIKDGNIKKFSGHIKIIHSFSNLWNILKKKYSNAQNYVVVRRNLPQDNLIMLETTDEITLSDDYPFLVWENVGSQYSYELEVNDKKFIIPGTIWNIIKFKLKDFTPGLYKYNLKVLQGKNVIYKSLKTGTIKWLSRSDSQSINKKVMLSNDKIIQATFLEDKGLKVAAMDKYHEYFEENPYDNEMRPILVKLYNDLNLRKLKSKIINLYHSQL